MDPAQLQQIQQKHLKAGENWYLARGELNGMSDPLWRSSGKTLRGRGFNCQEGDSKAVARDLYTGKPESEKVPQMPIIKTDDLLVTTGLEGIFPEDLPVARVKRVDPLEEGSFYYTLEAMPLIQNLDDMMYVEVILPNSFELE